MGVLEQVTNMKGSGMSEQEIVNDLSQRGVSPQEIDDALKQAQIKNAVSDDGGMQQVNPDQPYQPQAYEAPSQQYAPEEQAAYQPQEQQYAQAEQQQYAQGASGINADTVMEMADQVFSDKIKKFQKILDATSEAAILLQTKFENISERLKKIEGTIDRLQIAILEKVGSYGQNLESIKKEMGMMQDSFSKMISGPKETIQKQTRATQK